MSIFYYPPPQTFHFDDVIIQLTYNGKEIERISYVRKNSIENLGEDEIPNKGSLIQSAISYLDEFFEKGSINHKSVLRTLSIDEIFRTDFSQKVFEQVIRIPPGTTITYGDIANSIGSKAYQAIGNFLRSNKYPLFIPCHRVVSKSGLGGFMGKIEPESFELRLKKALLDFERDMNS